MHVHVVRENKNEETMKAKKIRRQRTKRQSELSSLNNEKLILLFNLSPPACHKVAQGRKLLAPLTNQSRLEEDNKNNGSDRGHDKLGRNHQAIGRQERSQLVRTRVVGVANLETIHELDDVVLQSQGVDLSQLNKVKEPVKGDRDHGAHGHQGCTPLDPDCHHDVTTVGNGGGGTGRQRGARHGLGISAGLG